MIKKNQAWLWKIFRAIKSIIIFSLRMIAATVLGLISIVSIFEWYEKPLNIHLLILAIISIFIVVHQIVIMTYESENDFRVLYVVQAPSRPNRSKKDDILDELKTLSKEELIEIRKDIVELINENNEDIRGIKRRSA